MKDSLYIGEVPCDEECTPAGHNPERERAECRAFINQLRRHFGNEPEGTRLKIVSNPHDFGTYLSVECEYDEDNEESTNYALSLESSSPEKWDEEAKKELGLPTKSQTQGYLDIIKRS